MLEPEGIVEVKFKYKDVQKTIYRLDPVIVKLKSDLSTNADISPEEKTQIETQIAERETVLKPMFHQVAVHFADLHDTPQRMLEKGVIAVRMNFINERPEAETKASHQIVLSSEKITLFTYPFYNVSTCGGNGRIRS